MSDTDETIPVRTLAPNFGVKFVFLVCLRWLYYNPLTVLLVIQAELIALLADHPKVEALSHAVSIFGVIIAQVRNQGKDYTAPLKRRYNKSSQTTGDAK